MRTPNYVPATDEPINVFPALWEHFSPTAREAWFAKYVRNVESRLMRMEDTMIRAFGLKWFTKYNQEDEGRGPI